LPLALNQKCVRRRKFNSNTYINLPVSVLSFILFDLCVWFIYVYQCFKKSVKRLCCNNL